LNFDAAWIWLNFDAAWIWLNFDAAWIWKIQLLLHAVKPEYLGSDAVAIYKGLRY
jgi:hypothetical protein